MELTRSGWPAARLESINQYAAAAIEPRDFPSEEFDLYSVPAYGAGIPEVLQGGSIGSRKQIVESGDVLVCIINPRLSRVWTVSGSATTSGRDNRRKLASTEWHVVRVPQFDADFLTFFFRSSAYRSYLLSNLTGIGGSLTRVSLTAMRNSLIPAAPKEVQAALGRAFREGSSGLSAAQSELAAALESQQALVSATLSDVHAEATRAAGRERDAVRLGDLASIGTGQTPSRKEPRFWSPGDVPWVTSGLTDQGVIQETSEAVSMTAVRELKMKVYPEGTLILGMYGNGRTRGQVAELGLPATINQACAAIEVESDLADARFVRAMLVSLYDSIRSQGQGASRSNLNLAKVRSIELPLPERGVQKAIADRVFAVLEAASDIARDVYLAQLRLDELSTRQVDDVFESSEVVDDQFLSSAADVISTAQAARNALKENRKAASMTRGTGDGALKGRRLSADGLMTVIESMPADTFSFDDLRAQTSSDYETLKAALFHLLAMPDSRLKQEFDSGEGRIIFRRWGGA